MKLAAAGAATWCAATAAAVSAAAGETAAREAATARLTKREVRRRRTCLTGERDVGHDIRALLQIAFDELGVLAVGDTKTKSDRFQLLFGVQPCATSSLDAWQRTEKRINSRCGSTCCCGGRASTRRVRSRRGTASAAWPPGIC